MNESRGFLHYEMDRWCFLCFLFFRCNSLRCYHLFVKKIALLFLAALVLSYGWYSFSLRPVDAENTAPIAVTIPRGASVRWVGELLAAQNDDVATLMGLFNDEFFSEGVVAFDEENAEAVVRSCAAIRLRLREHCLKPLGDETLESGDVDIAALDEPLRKAFMCYLFLATVQELIIQHLDASILES